jgi:hypothetical protein
VVALFLGGGDGADILDHVIVEVEEVVRLREEDDVVVVCQG